MKKLEKAEVKVGIIKKRKLNIDRMTYSGCEQKVEEALQELKGIKNIKADYKTGKLKLEYDLMEITLKDIEQKIVNLGYLLSNGFFDKLRRWVIHYTEENERDAYGANRSNLEAVTERTLVGEVLQEKKLLPILQKYKFPCLGCPLVQYEVGKLEMGDIARFYNIESKKLIKELNDELEK